MRLPLAHPPPAACPPRARCAYLEELAQACVGLPLAGAARRLMGSKGRGRHGNALQWHLGLEASDARAQLDWENRIEIKLVSVWARGDGTWVCDKLKVCDHGVDPWQKLSNVLWVLADRSTKVVLSSRIMNLEGDLFAAMTRSWHQDPHFDTPDLFVESRDRGSGMSPAYYLSASVMRHSVVEPLSAGAGYAPLVWNAKLAAALRDPSRIPVWVLIDAQAGLPRCPQCSSALLLKDASTLPLGWAVLEHPEPAFGCGRYRWLGVDGAMIPPSPVLSRAEQAQALLALDHGDRAQFLRLSDRCIEPEDHEHGPDSAL